LGCALRRSELAALEPLAQAIAQDLAGCSAILDGEIVHPGPDGRPLVRAQSFDGIYTHDTQGWDVAC
jgi:hypothetical protein